MQKRFQEYFAKVVLEHCFPDRFDELKVSDKPDLRCGQEVGIEVTNCMPEEVVEAFNLWHRIDKQGEQTPPRIIEKEEQIKEVQRDEKGLLWTQGTYTDNIDDSPIKYFINAVEKKVERLNSENANYAKMESYELFVNSFIFIPHYQINAVIQRIEGMNCKAKKFDNIYLITNEQKLLVFDMKNGTLHVKYLYSYLDRMANEAKELISNDVKNS